MLTIKKQLGVSILEVLLSVLILSSALILLIGHQTNVIKINDSNSERLQALFIAQELAARMRANPEGIATDYTSASTALDTCPTNPAVNCGGSGSSCSAAEVASFDIWEMKCDVSPNATSSSPLDFITVDDLNISCAPIVAGECARNAEFTIDVIWTAKQVTDLQDANVIDNTESATKTVTLEVVL